MSATHGLNADNVPFRATLEITGNYTSAEHREVMDMLRSIEAGQREFGNRLERLEQVLTEAKEGPNPTTARNSLDLFQDLQFSNHAQGGRQLSNEGGNVAVDASRPDRPSGSALPFRSDLALAIRRTRDIKDQWIEEEQERRERMHEAVDQIEGTSHRVRCVSCGSAIAKDCFVHNHFDWCIRHQYMANDDLEDRDGEPCQHEDAGEGFDCTIVHCDYMPDEWEEEEHTEWFNNQMARGSP